SLYSSILAGRKPIASGSVQALRIGAVLAPSDAGVAVAFVGSLLVLGEQPVGVVCGTAPTIRPNDIERHAVLIRAGVRFLNTILERDHRFLAVERRAEQAEQAALTDPLTGLFNRRGWDRQISLEASRVALHGGCSAVIFIDLDGLKEINDSTGHAAGDELLRRTATALRGTAREADAVARIGGDEFGILAVDADQMTARTMTKRLRGALAGAHVSAAIGFAQHDALKDIHQVCRDADRAMYEDKRRRVRSKTGSFAFGGEQATA
ncbi:MAG: GGDEF domain-containing protein, partial [Vulcanimicrobiaceae bacterium]